MDGIFVRKHAQAVSLLHQVSLLYLHSDPDATDFSVVLSVDKDYPNLTELRIYYPFSKRKFLGSVSKVVNFFRSFVFGYRYIVAHRNHIDLTQVNVLTRCGILAYLLSVFKRIPYVVVEHWTRYQKENYSYRGFLRRRLTELVVRRSRYLLPVSNHLAETMQAQGLTPRQVVKVNNVVEDFFFSDPDTRPNGGGRVRMICVTTFDEPHKNVSGIVRALAEVAKYRSDFILDIIGNGRDIVSVRNLVSSLSLSHCINFVGEVPPRMVSKFMHRADFQVMFSNFENAPVVVSEGLASGLPLVSSRVGGIAEMVDDSCALLVEAGCERELVVAIEHMLDNYKEYNRESIRQRGKAYSYRAVANFLNDIYNRSLA